MNRFLYVISYAVPASPEIQERWHQTGTVFLYILADDAEAADRWGQKVAERFVSELYRRKPAQDQSWYAGIETHPEQFLPEALAQAPEIQINEWPDVERWVAKELGEP